ncbi:Long-chain-fatty-acid--CoA ligase [Pseudovibrio sp. W64]|uniref:class I adenylate-forming enzyme family protein n=1 Tax=Pseudovibrio TaxID=258255 RepID=UPI0007B1DCA6|nr:class I adenylate-forming enzyme family protein [Pseudovibrio sp. W64]KZK81517.1 Long-chain-fatty-acid--CoA ligase [Pseudovibrio sp. W64]
MMHARSTLLTSFLDRAVEVSATSTSIEFQDLRLDFATVQAASRALAQHLINEGVTPGDRVVLLMANSAAFCIGFWATLYAGAVAVPLNPGTKRTKLGWIIADCTPAAVMHDFALYDTVRKAAIDARISPVLVAPGPDGLWATGNVAVSTSSDLLASPPPVIDMDLAAIIYTSGSTGDPKGVMLSHLNMTSAARSVAQYLGYTRNDRIFCSIPMTFDYGLHQLTMSTLVGACLIVEPSFEQPLFALQRLARSRATVFPVVPTMVPLIVPLADRYNFSSVRCISSTAAALHMEFIDQLTALFPNATLFSMYGLTECHRCTYLDPTQLETRKTSVGKAIPNTELWVVDEDGKAHQSNAVGELVIRGSTVMKGYWRNPDKTAEKLRRGSWANEVVLYTGDTCRLDEEGFVYWLSRSDDILKIAGQKVAPSEIEIVLMTHPNVAEVCVMGIEHPVYGQQCEAVVTLKNADCQSPEASDLKAWCTARLEPHAIPAKVRIIEAMPRNGNGKIDRHTLKEFQAETQVSAKQEAVLLAL